MVIKITNQINQNFIQVSKLFYQQVFNNLRISLNPKRENIVLRALIKHVKGLSKQFNFVEQRCRQIENRKDGEWVQMGHFNALSKCKQCI